MCIYSSVLDLRSPGESNEMYALVHFHDIYFFTKLCLHSSLCVLCSIPSRESPISALYHVSMLAKMLWEREKKREPQLISQCNCLVKSTVCAIQTAFSACGSQMKFQHFGERVKQDYLFQNYASGLIHSVFPETRKFLSPRHAYMTDISVSCGKFKGFQ